MCRFWMAKGWLYWTCRLSLLESVDFFMLVSATCVCRNGPCTSGILRMKSKMKSQSSHWIKTSLSGGISCPGMVWHAGAGEIVCPADFGIYGERVWKSEIAHLYQITQILLLLPWDSG
jgi:hypothetical protein